MNVSDLLQDSPSQHRKRPSGHDGTVSTANPSTTTTSSSSPVPQTKSQNIPSHQQSSSPQSHNNRPPPPPPPPQTTNTSYPPPSSGPYYAPSPFVPQRITPRQPPDQPMASLQHPHPHSPWGPRTNSGSSPLATGSSSISRPIERSPIVQRPNLITPTGTGTGTGTAPSHSPQTQSQLQKSLQTPPLEKQPPPPPVPNLNPNLNNSNSNPTLNFRDRDPPMRERDLTIPPRDPCIHPRDIRDPPLLSRDVILPRERDPPLLPRERDAGLLSRDSRDRDAGLVQRERERDPGLLPRERDPILHPRDRDPILTRDRDPHFPREQRERDRDPLHSRYRDERERDMDVIRAAARDRELEMERREIGMERPLAIDRRDPTIDRRDPAIDRRDPDRRDDRRESGHDRRDTHPHMERFERPRPPSERGPVPAGPGVLQLHPGPVHPHPHPHGPNPMQIERERDRDRDRPHAIPPSLDRDREMAIHREREALRERGEREQRERERSGDMQRDKPSAGERTGPGPGSGHRASPLSRPPYVPTSTHNHPPPHPQGHAHGHAQTHAHAHNPSHPPHAHPPPTQGRGRMLPGQGQFQALPLPHPHSHEWDREHAQAQRVDRERIDLRLPGTDREREREREQRDRLPTDQRLSERPGPGEVLQLRDPVLLVRDRENAGGREQRGEFMREREQRVGDREREQKVPSDREREQRERELRGLEPPDRRMGRRTHSQAHSRMPSPMTEERAMMEREREHFERERIERDRMGLTERERMEREHHEREYMERGMGIGMGERERMDREHLERIDRQQQQQQHNDAIDHERELDLLSREHIRERMALERERVEREALERLPTSQELAALLRARRERPHASLGTWVYPVLPFPWFFGDHIPRTKEGEGIRKDGLAVPPEVRLTVLIPCSFLPASRPHKLRLWGGGLLPPPPLQFWPAHGNLSSSNAIGNGSGPAEASPTHNASGPAAGITPNPPSHSYHPMHAPRRRVYTDDSDVLACAVHAGLLTWNAVSRARRKGQDIKIVLGVVPTVSSYGGSVLGTGTDRDPPGSGQVNGTPSNGVTPGVSNGITSSISQSSASQPTVLSHASGSNGGSGIAGATALDGMGYAGGVWASRFVGGWGEAFYGHPSADAGPSEEVRQRNFEEEAEDDGRGVVSAGWGWGHDGSAIEVVEVEVVEKGTSRGPGLGRRNRSQRLHEYASRRADLALSPATSASPPQAHLFADVTNGRKRRRFSLDGRSTKGKTNTDPENADELQKMDARTLVFGGSEVGAGFKYTPTILACALFPHLADPDVRASLPRKRRKVAHMHDPPAGLMDIDEVGDESGDERHAVVLDSDSEMYLVAPEPGPSEGYVLSVLLPTQPSEGKGKDVEEVVDDETTPRTTHKTSQTESSRGESVGENSTLTLKPSSPGALKDDHKTAVPVLDSQPQVSSPSAQPISPPPLAEKTGPQRSDRKVLRSNLKDGDFKFEQDGVVVCGRGDEMGIRVRVMRWRWYL